MAGASENGKARLTLAQLADEKRLPPDFLRPLGVHNLPGRGVGITYRDAAGNDLFVKTRHKLHGDDPPEERPSFSMPRGQRVASYGDWRMDLARRQVRLILVEGESDCWALWFHEYPALGIPGANNARVLTAEHLVGIDRVYIHHEPDAGGQTFVAGLIARLKQLAYRGRVFVFACPDGVKDPADLHARDAQEFKAGFDQSLRRAEPFNLDTGHGGACEPLPPSLNGSPTADAAPQDVAPAPDWPAPPGLEAYHGLAGDIVRAIEPSSEADPVALLVQLLVAFGNIVGRNAHFVAEAIRHYPNEFAVLVGRTSKGRKGSAWGHIHRLLADADDQWANGCNVSGLSSGEGVIWAVRDPIMKRERSKERGKDVRYEEVEADPGVADKRLLVFEAEYANVLRQSERNGNTLSAILRQAWDGANLRSLTKNSPATATGAHLSLIGHITADELRRYLSATEQANGYGNRHIWICVQRSKILPEGGTPDLAALVNCRARLADALVFGRQCGEMQRNDAARQLWAEIYGPLSEGRPGLTGAMLGRAEAHVMRMAMLFALLDCSPRIGIPHLMAAASLWDYAERSVRYIFGDSTGDPLADDLLRLLRTCPQGLTRTEITDYLGRHMPSDRIGRALGRLLENKYAHVLRAETAGRPSERWYPGPANLP